MNLIECLSDHIQSVNRNLDVKNTATRGLKESYNMLLGNEFLSGCGRCLSKTVSCSCVKTVTKIRNLAQQSLAECSICNLVS